MFHLSFLSFFALIFEVDCRVLGMHSWAAVFDLVAAATAVFAIVAGSHETAPAVPEVVVVVHVGVVVAAVLLFVVGVVAVVRVMEIAIGSFVVIVKNE